MLWLGMAGWVLLLGAWLSFAEYRKRHEIGTCEHTSGRVISVDDEKGNGMYLVWVCADCPFQANLRELAAVPGRDRFCYNRDLPRPLGQLSRES